MKKIIALLLVAVMCFSLAACGGDKETSNNNEPQTNNSETQQETENNTSQEDSSENAVNLVGTWRSDIETLILNEDGTGSFHYESKDIAILWEIKENELELRSAEGFEVEGTQVYSWFHFTIITDSANIELKSNDSDLVLTQEN